MPALARLSSLLSGVDEDDPRNAFGRAAPPAEQFGLSFRNAACLDLAPRRVLPLGTRDRALRSAAEGSGLPRSD